MHLKKQLHEFLQKDQVCQTFLATQNQLLRQTNINVAKENAEQVTQNILTNYPTFKNHPELLNLLADALQMIDDDELIAQYSLQDLATLYQSNIKSVPNNPAYYEDLGAFLYAVLDENEEAKIVLQEGIIKAKASLERLEKLLVEIEEEDI